MSSNFEDWRGNVALGLVTVQFGIQPFLTEAFVPPDGIKSSMVIIQELIKSFCCFIALIITGDLLNVIKSWNISNSMRIAVVPSIIYCTQNVLAFYAYLNLDPLTFNLINQSKIIFAAIFLKLILNKSQTKRQLLALSILFLTSIILTFDTATAECDINDDANSDKNSTYGLIAVLIASILSGLAGTLTQKALQSEIKPRNSYLFSSELALYGILFSLFRLYVENALKLNEFDGVLMSQNGFLYKLEISVLIPIAVNAIGGIGVGLITKFTSVIHKSYALIGGIFLSGIFRSFIYSAPMSFAMYITVPMVMVSLWLNADPSKLKKKKKQ